jgi:hypothetical protein
MSLPWFRIPSDNVQEHVKQHCIGEGDVVVADNVGRLRSLSDWYFNRTRRTHRMVGVSDWLLVLSKCSRDMCMEFLWILDTAHRIRVDSVSVWSTQRKAPRHTRKLGCSCRKFMNPNKYFWNIH